MTRSPLDALEDGGITKFIGSWTELEREVRSQLANARSR